jgi:hypothetical protein
VALEDAGGDEVVAEWADPSEEGILSSVLEACEVGPQNLPSLGYGVSGF